MRCTAQQTRQTSTKFVVVFSKRPVGNENSLIGMKSGRRRWGQTKLSDSWDESDPSDTAASNSKKNSMGAEEDKPINEFMSELVTFSFGLYSEVAI